MVKNKELTPKQRLKLLQEELNRIKNCSNSVKQFYLNQIGEVQKEIHKEKERESKLKKELSTIKKGGINYHRITTPI
jgi:hypothetical protein